MIDATAAGAWLRATVELGGPAGAGASRGTLLAWLDGTPVIVATGAGLAREHRFLAALADTEVPVPTVLGWCPDPSVAGEPFLVTSLMAGRGVLDVDGTTLDPAALANRAIDVLAALHGVDPAVLGGVARPGRYLERQIHLWSEQLASATRLGDLRPVSNWLFDHLPPGEERCLVHGDYGFHNLLVAHDTVAAVVDWELATIGDPLADLAFFVKSWGADALSSNPAHDAVALLPGAPDRRALEARYEALTGRRLDPYRTFYDVFALWRSIGIQEGVHARSGGRLLSAEVPAMVTTAISLTEAEAA